MFELAPGEFVTARDLLDTAPDAIVVVGSNARIVYANRQTETLFGYTRDELLGQSLDVLVPERFQKTHGAHIARFFGEPTVRSMGSGLELFGRRRDGTELPVELSLSPIQGASGTFVSAAIRDATERRNIQEELRRARIAAEAGSAAKSEFLASMSHELRTPLNAVLGFAQLSQRDKKDPLSERHRRRLEQILKGGEHLLRLIDDILDLARIEAGGTMISKEAVDPQEVIAEVVATLEPSAQRAGVVVEIVRTEDHAPIVVADRTRLAQILMNYGSNAVKYNRKNGTVRFDVVPSGAGSVRIVVTDSGLGIPANKRHTLFQPFQRAGQEAGPIEGTGIGLVISKRLAELMGGAVGYRPLPEGGSEFWVELPAHSSRSDLDQVPLPRDLASSKLARGARGRVLYVEDNPANMIFMTDLLEVFEGIGSR